MWGEAGWIHSSPGSDQSLANSWRSLEQIIIWKPNNFSLEIQLNRNKGVSTLLCICQQTNQLQPAFYKMGNSKKVKKGRILKSKVLDQPVYLQDKWIVLQIDLLMIEGHGHGQRRNIYQTHFGQNWAKGWLWTGLKRICHYHYHLNILSFPPKNSCGQRCVKLNSKMELDDFLSSSKPDFHLEKHFELSFAKSHSKIKWIWDLENLAGHLSWELT